jgi:hypothetical protein
MAPNVIDCGFAPKPAKDGAKPPVERECGFSPPKGGPLAADAPVEAAAEVPEPEVESPKARAPRK